MRSSLEPHLCLAQSAGDITQYSEFYNCLLSSNSGSMGVSSGTVNIYNCQTVGEILAQLGAQVKHVDSFHDGHFTAKTGATIWVSGMRWGQWVEDLGPTHNIDVLFELSAGAKVIVCNSKAGGQVVSYIVYVGTGCTFKAFNSEFNNLGGGLSITGDLRDPPIQVFLYYCVLRGDMSNVVQSADSVVITRPNSE